MVVFGCVVFIAQVPLAFDLAYLLLQKAHPAALLKLVEREVNAVKSLF